VILLADLLLLASGRGLLRRVAGGASFGVFGGLAFAWLAGVSLLALVTTLLGTAGLPTGPWLVAPVLLAVALWGRPSMPRMPEGPAALGVLLGLHLALTARHNASVVNDEYAIWSLRGRALSLVHHLDPALFANAPALYQHQDYPLLVPALLSWTSSAGGGDGAWHAQVALLTAAMLGVIGWCVSRLAGTFAGVVAVLAAYVTNNVTLHSIRVYADLPTAAYAVAVVLLLLLWLRDPSPWLLDVASVMAVGAVLAKNEGAPFVAFACVLAAVLARRLRPLVPLAVAAVAYLPWFVWSRLHDIGNDVVNADAGARAALTSQRLHAIARGMAHSWPLPFWWFWLFVLAAALAVRRGEWKAPALLAGTVVASVAVLAVIYVVTPLEVTSHIASSAPRVLMFPALLTAVGTAVLLGKSPDSTADVG
jgi:hypothetical protein